MRRDPKISLSATVPSFCFLRLMQDILVTPFCGVIDAFLECSLEVRHGLGATSEPHPRAKVISTSLTRPTIVTRHTNFQRHPLANLEAGDSITDSHNDSSRLMAQ